MLRVIRRRWLVGGLVGLGLASGIGVVWLGGSSPTAPAWEAQAALARAQSLDGRDDLDAAVAAYREALRLAPADCEACKGLAAALLRDGRPAEAAGALKSLAPADKDDETRWLASRAALQAGDLAGVAENAAGAAAFRSARPVEPEPAAYVGAARCGTCHKANHQAQIASAHARTFARAGDLKDVSLPEGPVVDPFDDSATHRLTREGDTLRLESKAGTDVVRAVAAYAFGSGDKGMTLVGTDDKGQARELRLSRYADPHGWQVTTGQLARPATTADLVGRALGDDELRGCFSCHVTRPDDAKTGNGPTSEDHAIGCESCHGPGGNHVLAVEARIPDLAIARANAFDDSVSAVCARCHGPKASQLRGPDPALGIAETDDVRFQSVSLPKSRCVTESGPGGLNCLTCHDPHRDAESSPAYYEAKCLACHGEAPRATRTACPVNPTNDCLSCHMPAVKTAVPHSTFTDHHIRVRREVAIPAPLRSPG